MIEALDVGEPAMKSAQSSISGSIKSMCDRVGVSSATGSFQSACESDGTRRRIAVIMRP